MRFLRVFSSLHRGNPTRNPERRTRNFELASVRSLRLPASISSSGRRLCRRSLILDVKLLPELHFQLLVDKRQSLLPALQVLGIGGVLVGAPDHIHKILLEPVDDLLLIRRNG